MDDKPDNEASIERGKRRTVGNQLFDWIVYPTIAFGAVFAFSIFSLHTTKFGAGKLRQSYINAVKRTEDWFARSFFKGESSAVLHKKADNYISVLVSFAAGTLIITPIKWFEDKRTHLSKFFDRVLGTTPDDPSLYAKEPKQGWRSVIGGRTVTFATILALATIAGKYINAGAEKVANVITGLKIKGPDYAGATNKWKWTYVSAFEGFYTALCAVLVYFTSRAIARLLHKENEPGLGEAVSVAMYEPDGAGLKMKYLPPDPQEQPQRSSHWSQKENRKPVVEKNAGYMKPAESSLTQRTI